MISLTGWRNGLLGRAALLCVAGSGCTAIAARAKIAGAESAIGEAEQAGAKSRSAYKYDMALLFLEKAREEEAYSRLGPAIDMGSKSEDFAHAAHEEAAGERPHSKPAPAPVRAAPADSDSDSDAPQEPPPPRHHPQADPEPL